MKEVRSHLDKALALLEAVSDANYANHSPEGTKCMRSLMHILALSQASQYLAYALYVADTTDDEDVMQKRYFELLKHENPSSLN